MLGCREGMGLGERDLEEIEVKVWSREVKYVGLEGVLSEGEV